MNDFDFVVSLTSSVTRFGEILPLWLKFSSLWPFLEVLFRIWQNVEHTLGIFLCFWANSILVKGQILNKLLSNLDTLLTSVKVGRNKMLTICLISCHKSWIVF